MYFKKKKERKGKERKTHQKRIDVSRGQTYGGIGFGCSISTGISQSFHLTNRRPEIRSARSSQPQNSEKEPFHCMSAGTDFIYQLFGRGLFWKGAVRYRLYYCWSAAEPYSVYTRDPPPPPLRLARCCCCCSTVARPEWPFSALIGRRAGRWGARETEGNTHTHTNKTFQVINMLASSRQLDLNTTVWWQKCWKVLEPERRKCFCFVFVPLIKKWITRRSKKLMLGYITNRTWC